MDYEEKTEILSEMNEEAIIFHDIEGALVGYLERCGSETIAIYDWEKCVEIFMEEGSTYEDAVDHMGFNVTGTYAGESTPGFIHYFDREDDTKCNCLARVRGWLRKIGNKTTETQEDSGG